MDNNEIKISLIVPIYGVEKFIERCALSLFNQTYKNIDYIFVNDCTLDNSIMVLSKVVAKYPNRKESIKIITHDNNKGLAAARKTGVMHATGDYLMHVDSDDWLELNAVEELVEIIKKNEPDIINFGYFAEYGKKTVINPCNDNSKDDLIIKILTNKNHSSIWSKIYKTDFYISSNIFAEQGLNQGEDYVVVPRLLYKAKKYYSTARCFYHYEMSNVNSYTKNINFVAINNIYKADEILYDFFSKITDKKKFEKALDVLYVRSMLYLIKTSNYKGYDNIYKKYFCDINEQGVKLLSFTDRMLLILIKHRCYLLIGLIVKIWRSLL